MQIESLLPAERQKLIRDRLAADGRVVANDLARALDVSEDTIRRDLRDLAREGFCRRVYGGALAPAPPSPALAVREAQPSPERLRLAAAAAALVRPGMVIFLDAGSTNSAVAAALPTDIPLTVATNAPSVVAALAGHRQVELILIGGVIDREKGASLGAVACRQAAAIRADIAFVGACAVDPDAGVTALSYEEAAFKRAVCEGARAVAIVAGTAKLGTAGAFDVLPAARLDHLVVGEGAPPALLDQFRGNGSAVHIA